MEILSLWLAATGLALTAFATLKILAPNAAPLQQFDQVLRDKFGFLNPPDVLSFYFFSLMLLARWSFALLLGLLLLAIASWLWSSFKAWRSSRKDLIPGLTAAVGLLILQVGSWARFSFPRSPFGFFTIVHGTLSQTSWTFRTAANLSRPEPCASGNRRRLHRCYVARTLLLFRRHAQDYGREPCSLDSTFTNQ